MCKKIERNMCNILYIKYEILKMGIINYENNRIYIYIYEYKYSKIYIQCESKSI